MLSIKVENLSKAYQLGEIGTGTISRDLERWYAKVRGKEDPFLKIGEANDRAVKGTSDVVWSLKDINLEINEGDAVGIIGRNGAGKSTLLKILSRVTSPTTGNIKIKGRIASLLEVGTGFHPELTGRENIYLNGAILGMRKKEIQRKFDEIVDFSGVERYVDTPVKRYSSGMYVRLAFAVAAYLESEILIVDEVLAVGDGEFQKKCLGKMGEVSKGEGRTVLFVSHNMTAISNLCNYGMVLNNGQLQHRGNVNECIRLYRNALESTTEWNGDEGDETVRLRKTWVRSLDENGSFDTSADIEIGAEIDILQGVTGMVFGFNLISGNGQLLAHLLFDDMESGDMATFPPCSMKKTFVIPKNTLAKGIYDIEFDVGIWGRKRIIRDEGFLSFQLERFRGLGMRFPEPDVPTATSLFRPNWHSNLEVTYTDK